MTRYLIAKIGEESVDGIRMMKLLYLAEREALVSSGAHVCDGQIRKMGNGPVLNGVYELVNGRTEDSYWSRFISYHKEPGKDAGVYRLKEDSSEFDYLSRHDRDILDRVFSQYGAMPKDKLVDLTHKLPEWLHCSGGVITDRDILTHEGWDEDAIAQVEADAAEEAIIARDMKELAGDVINN